MQRQQDDSSAPGSADLEWVAVGQSERESGSGRSPRRFALVALVTAFLVATAGPMFAGSTVAASFTASDVEVTSNNGHLESLTVAPNGTVTYDGLENEPADVVLAIEVESSDGTWDTVETQSLSATGLEGSVSYDFTAIDLIDNSALEETDFHATPGSTTDTTVNLRMNATLVGAGPNSSDVHATASDTFTVSVTNQPASGGVGGSANTNGQGQ